MADEKRHALKILAVSDYVDPLLKEKAAAGRIEDIDLVISCGDLPPEYLSFLRDRLDCPLYYVKGNHDIRYHGENPVGCRNIHGRIHDFESLSIVGLEGSMWYNGGPNQYTDAQMKKIVRRMRFRLWWKRPVDIVVTHAPPRHIHDAEDRCHTGFESFVRFIQKYRPARFLHGHIHRVFQNDAERITRVGKTDVINVCGYYIFEV